MGCLQLREWVPFRVQSGFDPNQERLHEANPVCMVLSGSVQNMARVVPAHRNFVVKRTERMKHICHVDPQAGHGKKS